jgi:hypothetical protein
MRLSCFFGPPSRVSERGERLRTFSEVRWTICLSEGPRVEVSEAAKDRKTSGRIWKRSEHFPS